MKKIQLDHNLGESNANRMLHEIHLIIKKIYRLKRVLKRICDNIYF